MKPRRKYSLGQHDSTWMRLLCGIVILLGALPTIAQQPELMIPTGHTGPISSLDVSDDGTVILTGSLHGDAILWNCFGDQLGSVQDLSIYQKVGLFSNLDPDEVSQFGIAGVGILADGRMITGSRSSDVSIWTNTGELEKKLDGHDKGITKLAVRPDGKAFITGDDNGWLIAWNDQGKVLWQEKNAHNQVTALTYSPNGKFVYSGGVGGVIKSWDAATGKNQKKFKKNRQQGSIVNLVVSPDGKYLLAGNEPRSYLVGSKPTRSAFIYDQEGKVYRELKGHNGSVTAVGFTAYSGVPIVGTSTGEVVLYPEGGNPRTYNLHRGEVTALLGDASQKGINLVISGGMDGTATHIHTDDNRIMSNFDGSLLRMEGFGASRNDYSFIWYDQHGKGGYFDLSERLIQPIENVFDPTTLSKYIGKYAGPEELQDYKLTYNGFTTIEKVNNRSGEVTNSDLIENHSGDLISLLSTDGKRGFVAINFMNDTEPSDDLNSLTSLIDMDAGRQKLVSGRILDYESQRYINVRGHGRTIISADFSSDSRKVLTGSRDATAMLWTIDGEATTLIGHDEDVSVVAFSPDDQTIVTAGEDQKLFFRDSEGRITHTFGNIGFIPRYLHFSPDGNFLFAAGRESIIHLFDVASAKKLGRLFLFKDNDWAFVGEDGLFDASPGAMAKMYYIIPSEGQFEKLELDQLKARFFEPGVVGKRLGLSSERPRSAEGLTNVPLFPEVKPEIKGDELSVTLKARSGGLGPVSVFVNDKEVAQDANPDRKDKLSVDLRPFHRFMYRHPDSTNQLAIRAYNQDGWLKSPAIILEYQPEKWEPLATKKGTSTGHNGTTVLGDDPSMFVISIGTANYTGDKLDLKYPDQDAQAMARALQSVGSQLFALPGQIEVHCLNTDENTKQALTQQGISWHFADKKTVVEVLKGISEKARAQDIVLVYMSGHGVAYGSAEQTQFYYLTQGISTDDLSDTGIRERYTISSNEMANWMNQIPALKQVLVIDACNSGSVIENLSGTKDLNSGQILALDRMKDRTGMFVLSGSAADKVSYESSEFGQGLLTYSLLQGMMGAATRRTLGGDFVDVMTLFQHARDQVPGLAASISGIQTPMLSFPRKGSSFDIGIYNNTVDIPIARKKPVFTRANFQNENTFDDNLGLMSKLEERFREDMSRAADASLVYVDVFERTGSYSVRGRYTETDEGILLIVRLFHPDGSSEPLEIGVAPDAERATLMIMRAVKRALR